MSAEDSRFVVFLDGSPATGVAAERRQANAIAQAAGSSCLNRPRFVLRQSMVTSTAPPWRGTPSRFSSTTPGGLGSQNAAGAGKWSWNLIDGGSGSGTNVMELSAPPDGPCTSRRNDRGARTGRYGGTGEASATGCASAYRIYPKGKDRTPFRRGCTVRLYRIVPRGDGTLLADTGLRASRPSVLVDYLL